MCILQVHDSVFLGGFFWTIKCPAGHSVPLNNKAKSPITIAVLYYTIILTTNFIFKIDFGNGNNTIIHKIKVKKKQYKCKYKELLIK